jgi:hypothetical protein
MLRAHPIRILSPQPLLDKTGNTFDAHEEP